MLDRLVLGAAFIIAAPLLIGIAALLVLGGLVFAPFIREEARSW